MAECIVKKIKIVNTENNTEQIYDLTSNIFSALSVLEERIAEAEKRTDELLNTTSTTTKVPQSPNNEADQTDVTQKTSSDTQDEDQSVGSDEIPPKPDRDQGGSQPVSQTAVYPSGASYKVTNDTTFDGASMTSFDCSTSDYNVFQVTSGTLTLANCTITKSGDTTSDGDNSSFYGVNSAVFCGPTTSTSNTAFSKIYNGTITTNAKGANAVFATRQGEITISGTKINTTKDTSRGLHATYGGIINATNIDITTEGQSCSTIATDRGGGYVDVTGGSAKAKGTNSAVLYSTGTIKATNLTGTSEVGEIAVVEGDNSVTITNCNMTSGSAKRALMLLQSGSGDSTGYDAYITIKGGSLIVTNDSTPLCEIPTNTTGTLTLTDVDLTVPSNILMKVDYNTQWSTNGATGNLILSTESSSKEYAGNIVADSYSNVNVTINKNVNLNGSINNENTAKSSSVIVNGIWTLNDDSTITTLVINEGGTVITNGYTLHYTNITKNGTLK